MSKKNFYIIIMKLLFDTTNVTTPYFVGFYQSVYSFDSRDRNTNSMRNVIYQSLFLIPLSTKGLMFRSEKEISVRKQNSSESSNNENGPIFLPSKQNPGFIRTSSFNITLSVRDTFPGNLEEIIYFP